MKKLLLLFAAIAVQLLPVMADEGQHLIINGEQVEKAVVKMTFEDDYVILHFVDQTTQGVNMDSIVLKFDVEANNIYSLKGIVTDKMSIEGMEPGTEVIVYDVSGRVVLTTKVSEAKLILSAKQLKSGVYVMKAGRQAVKFTKR